MHRGKKLDCLREYLSLSLPSNNRKKPQRAERGYMFRYWCSDSKKRFLVKGELEVLNAEDFKCHGVAFLYGSAFSIFMLENSSSWAALFLQHIQENLKLLVLPDTFVIINHSCILSQRFLLPE